MTVVLSKSAQVSHLFFFFFSSRRRHTRLSGDWSSDVCSSDLWGHEESDTTERLPFHFSLSRIGEGNGNLLQCPCLENPRDGGAWWAAVCGVTHSQTRLKRLSSSSQLLLLDLVVFNFHSCIIHIGSF